VHALTPVVSLLHMTPAELCDSASTSTQLIAYRSLIAGSPSRESPLLSAVCEPPASGLVWC
jgi:hypothetical protein